MQEKMVKTSLKLPELLWNAVRIRAIETHVDAQDIVRMALEQFLKKGGKR